MAQFLTEIYDVSVITGPTIKFSYDVSILFLRNRESLSMVDLHQIGNK